MLGADKGENLRGRIIKSWSGVAPKEMAMTKRHMFAPVVFHFLAGTIQSGDTSSEIAFPYPAYIQGSGSILSLSRLMFNILIVGVLFLCFWSNKRLDRVKKVVISGFGIFLLTSYALSSIPLLGAFSQLSWIVSGVIGITAAVLSLSDKYANMFYTPIGSFISTYIVVVVLRISGPINMLLILAIAVGLFFLMSRFSPQYHYAICKSLFTGILLMVLIDVNIPPLGIFEGFHHGTGKDILRRIIGLLLLSLTIVVSLLLTLSYDMVREKVSEYKERVWLATGILGGQVCRTAQIYPLLAAATRTEPPQSTPYACLCSK